MTRRVWLLAVITGVATGLAVALFDRVVFDQLADRLLRAPLWFQAVAPVIGLIGAAVILRTIGRGATPMTADEYIKNFHEEDHEFEIEKAPARVLASAATLGGGAALGFEGPSIYMGAAIGAWLQRTFRRAFLLADNKLLMTCGAAAGVAAIFKAPATGLVFALEVPYRQDIARRMLLPAMFSAAASYVVFASINGTEPLFPISGSPPFDLRDLGGAAALGLVAGGLARAFSALLRLAKGAVNRVPLIVRLGVAAVVIVGAFVVCRVITGESLTVGPGYETIAWSLRPDHSLGLVLGVFALRAMVTVAAIGGGGAGGLFIPLVVQGAVLGSAMGVVVGGPQTSLFTLLGVSAFLGAGYRVPLAAVVFVAETSGQPEFVVPALIAAATSQLFMGNESVSAYQQDTRIGR